MNRIYLDHAATTPLRPEVLEVMIAQLAVTGNPSSLHAEGRRARSVVDGARASIARLLGARAREIVFTGGGTEADNLAIFGVARSFRSGERHAITLATEHHAILHAFEVLRDEGWDVSILPVDAEGRIDTAEFARMLRPTTRLASAALVNNELGVIAPIADLAAIAHEHGVLFHTDAVQAAAFLPLNVRDLGVDLLTFSAHKLGGPQGVGLLFVRDGVTLVPQIVGGGQEAVRRAGTENVAGIVGLARAFELACDERVEAAMRLAGLRERFEGKLLAMLAGARVNGEAAFRAPHIANIALGDLDAQALLAHLDLEGVAVSLGSACAAGALEPSHVLRAMGAPTWVLQGSVRFSFGRRTSDEEVDGVLKRVAKVVAAVCEKEER
ncbi:MAG TPA: cysteine desulfurase family protein [Candidatus Baltobacteraceae bacterium]|jgi:cysteine desulfurase|nr:cysteine desulfurase family protein [Candidatus Baltobacteraceae bacterium]